MARLYEQALNIAVAGRTVMYMQHTCLCIYAHWDINTFNYIYIYIYIYKNKHVLLC